MVDRTDLRFTFTAGDESFEVVEFILHEGLSETFLLQVELASTNAAIDFGQVLDRNGLLTIWQGGLPVRYVHGAVSSFVQGETGFRRTRYSAVIEPRLARLKLSSDWRIFQTLRVPEIATAVLKSHSQTLDYEQRVTAEHLAREYCVQAGDTDYDFIERILREEGFFYAFQHKADGHRLIHCDRLFIFGRQQGEPVLYNPTPGGDQPQPSLSTFAYTENVRTARQVQRDYTFKSPRFPHEYPREGTDLDHQGRGYARYDYPGRYKHEASGKTFTQDRLRGHRRDACIATVSGDDARLQPGIAFDLTGHPRDDMNRGWRPVSLVHHGKQYTSQAEESADAQQGTHYRYEAVLVPDDAEWRAEPLPRPRIDGPQPATVVGPEGEEIYTDEYGRVKVQFPWDREGKHDEHSSCWIQVAQNWAGATWGHMAIPRIGQEVIVVNLDGDPDQPLIIGRAYNRLQLPPYELPRHKTRMTIKSQTHKGEGYNELRFEDEKDQEEIYVHAQRDQNIHVNHDETIFVGHDRSEQVEHDETIAIGNDRTETVGHDEQVTIGQDRRHDIGQDDFLTIGRNHTIHTGKDRTEEVGNHRRDKTAANHTADIGGHLEQRVAGRSELEAGQNIRRRSRVIELAAGDVFRLRGPGGTITLDDGGIALEGVRVHLKGPLNADKKGSGNAIDMAGIPIFAGLPLTLPEESGLLESTFALDQLTGIAQRCTKGEFTLMLAPIFGFDVPAHTYIKLYDGLRQGTIANPEHRLMRQGKSPADYDNRERVVRVHTLAVERARTDNEASSLLLAALLHEFGHHIDNLLRHDLADRHPDGTPTLADDSPLDEGARYAYRMALFDFESTTQVTYAHYTGPAGSGPLTLDYAEASKAIRALQGGDAHEHEEKTGTREAFGAGRGEHHDTQPDSSFGHESIEDALSEAGFTPKQRKQIYFGNWLRDFSQALDPSIVRPPSAKKDLSRYLSREVLTRVLDLVALRKFPDIQNKNKKFMVGKDETYMLDMKMLGVYRPSEHIDNPTNFKPSPSDPRTVDPAFEPWALEGDPRLAVDKASSMKRYIFDSKDYMSAQLNLALGTGPTADGFRYFGAALHVLEDYFSHSNFVELSLRKFHPQVLAWTAPRSSAQSRHALPVVTGMFGSLDVIASVAEPIAQMLFPVDEGEFKARQPNERSDGEKALAILLEDHSDPRYLIGFDRYLSMRDFIAGAPGYKQASYVSWLLATPLRKAINAYNLVFQALMQLVGNSVDDVQTHTGSDPNADASIDPTHSQLGKDHDVHPFHALAAMLAKYAVRDVGQAMKARWEGRRTATDPVTLAASYLVHPNDCQWQDAMVKAWAQANPDAIRRGASRTELEHLHEVHGKRALERLRQIGRYGVAGRDYIHKHYETLFGEKNQISR